MGFGGYRETLTAARSVEKNDFHLRNPQKSFFFSLSATLKETSWQSLPWCTPANPPPPL